MVRSVRPVRFGGRVAGATGYGGGKMSEGQRLLPELEVYVRARCEERDRISAARKQELEPLAEFVRDRVAAGGLARLVFICTHNSRRSHIAQLWAQAAARFFAVPGVETYSGGTEATAFNARAVAALCRAGIRIQPFTSGKNPIYEVSFASEMEPMQAYSKVYTDPVNPQRDFAAVMTCASADAACPIVDGAEERFAIAYRDPKESDQTAEEAEAYDARCRQIAREMLEVFKVVADG